MTGLTSRLATRGHTKTQTRTLQGPVGKESLDSRVRKLMSSPTGLIMSTRERLALVLVFDLFLFMRLQQRKMAR